MHSQAESALPGRARVHFLRNWEIWAVGEVNLGSFSVNVFGEEKCTLRENSVYAYKKNICTQINTSL